MNRNISSLMGNPHESGKALARDISKWLDLSIRDAHFAHGAPKASADEIATILKGYLGTANEVRILQAIEFITPIILYRIEQERLQADRAALVEGEAVLALPEAVPLALPEATTEGER